MTHIPRTPPPPPPPKVPNGVLLLLGLMGVAIIGVYCGYGVIQGFW